MSSSGRSMPRHPAISLLASLSAAVYNARAAPSDVPLNAAAFYIQDLPGLTVDPSRPMHMYSGHIPSDPSLKPPQENEITPHIFFFMIKARRLADKERIIFWFNGGPGCSSFDGLMLESGPLRTDGKGGLKLIDGGWDEYSTVVFVDQPPGTGLSYTSTNHYVHELDEGAQHVVQFMRGFYAVFPEYKRVETYLAGESYAGQYIPYIAQAILSSNLNTPLKGLAMGNAWIDARTQYPGYLEFGLKYDLIKEGSDEYKYAKTILDQCMDKLNSQTGPLPPSLTLCEEIMSSVLRGLQKEIAGKKMCLNVYDIRLSDNFPECGANWPIELVDIKAYLRRPDVLRALHATDKSQGWVECNHQVNTQLRNKHSASSITLLPRLLERLEILLFSGDQDFICNYIGTENMIKSMEWNGAKGLGDAETLSWIVAGVDAGTWVTARNLSYVKVFNSSHMVPYDVPQRAHDMMLRFMGLDFSQLASGSAKVSSKLGNDSKPELKPTIVDHPAAASSAASTVNKTPEQNKAMWEAYYNAGSAALTLVIIALAIGLFFFCRRRRRRQRGMAVPTEDPEEQIPLRQRSDANGNGYHDVDEEARRRKGKEREIDDGSATVFEVGSDGEEDYRAARRS